MVAGKEEVAPEQRLMTSMTSVLPPRQVQQLRPPAAVVVVVAAVVAE